MHNAIPLSTEVPTRDLLRLLRTQPDILGEAEGVLPESVLWRCYCELRRRGESDVEQHFLRSVRVLHRRRSTRGTDIPSVDVDPDEHKLVDDPMLSELWRAYKRCICSQRTGPASRLLRDIEAQITRH